MGSVGHGPTLYPTRGRVGRATISNSTEFYCCLQARLPGTTTFVTQPTMAIVDFKIDALTEPLQGTSMVEDCYTPQANWVQHLNSVGGRNRKIVNQQPPKRRLERCAYCKQLLLTHQESFTQPHCCSKAYLSNTQRYIHRCMMKINHADAQRRHCQALLSAGKTAMIIELQFVFQDGWVEQTYVASDDYYEIVRRTVTKQDLKQWKIPFASLSKVSSLTYPAHCNFTPLIYNECVVTGLLTKPRTFQSDSPIQFTVREAGNSPAEYGQQPVSPLPDSPVASQR